MESGHDIRTSDQVGDLADALAKAQGEYPVIEKNRIADAGSYKYKYADIADVLAAVRPALAKHGLAFTQPTVVEGGTIFIRTRLIHKSGQWMESDYPVASYQGQNHQKIGAALTYSRRYAGCAMLGVAAEEDMDATGDAATADQPRRQARRPQREAPEVVSSSGNGKSLPPVVGEDHSPPQETVATEPPHEIGTSQKNGATDWTEWGSWLSAALKNAKDGKTRAAWMEKNEHLLRECEEEKPEIHGRIMEVLDALNNPPGDELDLDAAGREA